MPYMNEVRVMGHLGRDPEYRTAGNSEVANFSLATTRKWKTKGSDEWSEETTWHNIVWWNPYDSQKAAMKKGGLVLVEGRLQTRNYDDRDGVKRYVTEIVADRVHYLRDANGEGKPQQQRGNAPAAKPDVMNHDSGGVVPDDDVPF